MCVERNMHWALHIHDALKISLAIPRVILRKKSALETLRPLFRDISQSVNAAAQHGSEHTDGRVFVSCISGFVGSAYQWALMASPDGSISCRVRMLAAS